MVGAGGDGREVVDNKSEVVAEKKPVSSEVVDLTCSHLTDPPYNESDHRARTNEGVEETVGKYHNLTDQQDSVLKLQGLLEDGVVTEEQIRVGLRFVEKDFFSHEYDAAVFGEKTEVNARVITYAEDFIRVNSKKGGELSRLPLDFLYDWTRARVLERKV